MVKPLRMAAFTVSVVDLLPTSEPLMVALVSLLTAVVVMLKVALVAPLATVTLAGTLAHTLPEDKVTVTPPTGAGPPIVTVPTEPTVP